MFSFLEKPGHSTKLAPVVQSSRSAISDEVQEVHEVQILILGTLDEVTKEDLATIDTSLVSVFHEAYTKAEFVLDSFEALANVDAPDAILLDAGKMIFATGNVSQWWNNHHCRQASSISHSTPWKCHKHASIAHARLFFSNCGMCHPDDDATAAAVL